MNCGGHVVVYRAPGVAPEQRAARRCGVLEQLRSAAEIGFNSAVDDALYLMAVVKIWADLQIVGNGVEEEPGADRLPTKHGESLVTVRAGPVVVWDCEGFDLRALAT